MSRTTVNGNGRLLMNFPADRSGYSPLTLGDFLQMKRVPVFYSRSHWRHETEDKMPCEIPYSGGPGYCRDAGNALLSVTPEDVKEHLKRWRHAYEPDADLEKWILEQCHRDGHYFKRLKYGYAALS